MLALYPGTFDPFTYGHLDILERALRLFDEVEVTIAVNVRKEALFSLDDRLEMIRRSTAHLEGACVAAHEGLVVERASARGAVALVRGVRQVSDFDYESSIAAANRRLDPNVETILLATSEAHASVSSTIVREVYRWNGDVSHFVPPAVAELMERRKANVKS